MRGRSPSYSPPPRRGRGRSPSPRGRYPLRREPLTSLLVRNLGKDWRADDLRGPFREFGPLRDVYLPRDYYTREPRGFGFVQYIDPMDAEDAQYYMNHSILYGREITVVFAEENRKKPSEMRSRERPRSSGYGEASPLYYGSRSRSHSSSRSPRRHHRSRSRSEDHVREPDQRISRCPVRYSHNGMHAQSTSGSKMPILRAPPGRRERFSRSPGSSPLPPRRQHISHTQQSPSESPTSEAGVSSRSLPDDY